MIDSPKPVLFDVRVDPKENCYPMIPSGRAHNEMILSDAMEEETVVSDEGKMLV
jgi:acetolactate synthase-1/2/3 large subunit